MQTFGGNEGFAEIPDPDVHCYPAYKTLMTNTTKYNTMFSDFMPLASQKTEFMVAADVCAYAKAYADNFKLRPKIKLNAHVTKVDKKDKKWHVTYTRDGKEDTDVVDNVMIATGAFAYPNVEHIPGIEKFKGQKIHTGQARNGAPLFGGKRVLIIGGAYSAGEMMNMALRNNVAKLYVSASRRPETKSTWTIGRYVKSIYGDFRPWDYLMTRENGLTNGDYITMMGHWCYAYHKTKPDAFLSYPADAIGITCVDIVDEGRKNGTLEFVGPVTGFGAKNAVLRDGGSLDDLDLVVFATGYAPKFPFLDHLWPRKEQMACELYNYVVSPNPAIDGIGFVLMQAAAFSLLPSAEMQARWFTHKIIPRAYKDDGTIFSAEERAHMRETIAEKHRQRPPYVRFNYIDSVPLLIDYLAQDIGVAPPDYKALVESGDPAKIELGVALAYGPYIGTQYRIQGAHAWPGAADECIALSKRFLGKHFDEYVAKVKQGIWPRSGVLDLSKGPYDVYSAAQDSALPAV